ncbi:MAG: hypothetical protein DRN66_04365 [Candidatus Nanohalarchaeota archaeon]|nr:MAG: hypothetical protein DRN66_04365 [Candidatus Nanohaloarchaeota archaeon]
MISSPKELVKNCSNLSQNEWKNTHDERTGCYLQIEYERTKIIKYFFWIAFVLIFSNTFYFLCRPILKEKSKKKEVNIEKTGCGIAKGVFIIWSFQEGINILQPMVRPTTITLFDLSLIITPIFAILVFFIWKTLIKRIKKTI